MEAFPKVSGWLLVCTKVGKKGKVTHKLNSGGGAHTHRKGSDIHRNNDSTPKNRKAAK